MRVSIKQQFYRHWYSRGLNESTDRNTGMGETMTKAVFLDRDGVINEDAGYVCIPEKFHFTEGIFELCRTIQEMGYLLIVITNQAGIARGYYAENDFHSLNEWMLSKFKKHGIDIAAVYYCPFHPEYGVGKYKQDSFDRKPNPGMIIKAREEFDIELSKSVLIGDKDSDIETGRKAGIGTLIFLKGKYQFTPANDVSAYESLSDIDEYVRDSFCLM